MKPRLYSKAIAAALKSSLASKHFLKVFLWNAVFVMSILVAFKIFTSLSQDQFTALAAVNLENLQQKTREEMVSINQKAREFIQTIVSLGIAFLIIEVFILSLTQASIYGLLENKKARLKTFILANYLWVPLWVILFIAIAFGSNPSAYQAASTVLVLLFLHFTLFLYPQLALSRVGVSFRHAFAQAIKLHRVIVPYALIFIVYLIASNMTLATKLLPKLAAQTANILLLTLLISWVQLFHAAIPKNNNA
ncbi:hypothetical protein HYV84_06650 [Candidatus Woesearchaeota archaeon]|nr:hypothetical protein [Candidatus Woesearchaeota archaeon]